MSKLRRRLAAIELNMKSEKAIRIKYQDIVYKICSLMDRPSSRSNIDDVVSRVAAMMSDPRRLRALSQEERNFVMERAAKIIKYTKN